ncbi:MAG: triose-phosphate isomerase [Gammaproteobacteria bacterium]|nr:triose-phosphate isomerase [Gammaproteobacteria bacterium]
MRRKLVAGNWKMHGTRALVGGLLEELKPMVATASCEVLVCPPFVFLEQAEGLVRDTAIALGAQDLATDVMGAYTGEVSGGMLREFGCRYVLVGHSERRSLYGESDELVARKCLAALNAGLTPIVCVGETLAERDGGETLSVVFRQLQAVLALVGVAGLSQAVIAYEPVWAIGTGRTATPEQAQEVHAALRGFIAKADAELAEKIRILYGGSVKADNAAELFAQVDIDGGLIGGASLSATDFAAICAAAG